MNIPEKTTLSSSHIIPDRVSAFGRWLIEPAGAIKDAAQRRRAQLLSILLLFLFVLFASINLVYWITVPGYRLPPADLIGYGFLLLVYILSRTRFTRLAVILLLVMFPLNVFDNVIEGTTLNLMATLSFLIPSFILASIFLDLLGTAIYGYGVNIIILLLPFLAPHTVTGFAAILGSLSVGLVVVTLCLVWTVHRSQIERDRQAELKRAYDSTLEGWSRALEIRDSGTQGHSRRVLDLTVRMGRAFDLHDEELDYLYRGALLHDIGKMAIPDAILLKPASLNDEEWKVMRRHPQIACDMLSSIDFLQPALAIPAYHHEWWNGQGYPTGLSGEQIPLPARIFAVVDVWDALLSDRPYRQAWSRDQAAQYLKEQSGKQFDPQIVERFFALQA